MVYLLQPTCNTVCSYIVVSAAIVYIHFRMISSVLPESQICPDLCSYYCDIWGGGGGDTVSCYGSILNF